MAASFSTFVLRSCYHQVEMDSHYSDKNHACDTAVIFRFNVIPFGLYTTRATVQRQMNVAMAGPDPLVFLVYLDVIIVHSNDLPTLLDRLRLLIVRLLATGLKLKVSCCVQRWIFSDTG